MSANCCIAFFGLRFEIASDEIEGLETRSDPRLVAARTARLNNWWGNVGAPEERYLLFIGTRLAILGPEDSSETVLSSDEIAAVVAATREKLKDAGLPGEPSLYLQWVEDS